MFLREGRAAACYLKHQTSHEVGGPNAERRQDDRGGKNGSSSAHGKLPPAMEVASMAAFLAAATESHAAVSAAREYPL
jgi:hypothetical protein